MPSSDPPFSPCALTSPANFNLQLGKILNVPMVFESVKLAYRYVLLSARPTPLACPESVDDPAKAPLTLSVETTIPATSPEIESDTKTHCSFPFCSALTLSSPKYPPPIPPNPVVTSAFCVNRPFAPTL